MSPNKSMDEDTTYGRGPIYTIAKQCLFQFKKFARQPENQLKETISTNKWRFLLWAQNHSVFAHKSASLDTQLIIKPEVRDLVIEMLDVLHKDLCQLVNSHWERLLEQCSTSLNRTGNTSSNDGPQLLLSGRVTGAMAGIVGSIDRLYRLSVSIRAPPTDYSSPAERIIYFAKQLPRDGFEDMTSLILKSKFPKAEDRLITKLTKSVVFRRHRLLYQRHNNAKLIQARCLIATEVVGLLNSMSKAGKGRLEEQRPIKADQAKQHKLQNQSLHQYENAPDDELACVTNTTILEEDWVDQKHVDYDMEHYICLSDKCKKPLCYFKTFDSWMKHMCSEHGQDWPRFIYAKKSEWRCALSKAHNTLFADQDSLRKHLEIDHSEEYLDQSDLQLIVDHCKIALPRAPDICPLCEESVDDPEPAAQQSKVENGKRPKKRVRWADEAGGELESEEKTSNTNSGELQSEEKMSKTNSKIAAHIARHLKSISFLCLRGLGPQVKGRQE
ncbi:uncharacterized protein TRIVIDRAFT_217707 [Trichoderma virens Gv29-8]|uniref:C2H2-type domain-containing protein n=1 Tax=Hypocrea virens (strain Gv29-8 / FGSC 10586) TaxID=413071 RepID=G9MFE5_HYPVG|nr:uncharacterized protein TRIVIDRAFT_217707 [Trichoderma virens Gv29-8]EHK27111.1 hypothetical protein TRIVIDRAFT_217707 [Trichoderma virens Gv29-8]UKZ57563.1 hypothetical protein TrVGV298_011422 [Trichoderma virens]